MPNQSGSMPSTFVTTLMKTKLQILLLTFFLTGASIGQNLKIDTSKIASLRASLMPIDTNSVLHAQHDASTTLFLKQSFPLVIINGRTFKQHALWWNVFIDFDTTNVSTIQVLNPKNDSIKLYGKAGKNGVIIITTKRPIEWISMKQILKQKSSDLLCSHKKTLIKIDRGFNDSEELSILYFDSKENLYFEKGLIDISIVNNKMKFYIDRTYDCVITITVKKKSGT